MANGSERSSARIVSGQKVFATNRTDSADMMARQLLRTDADRGMQVKVRGVKRMPIVALALAIVLAPQAQAIRIAATMNVRMERAANWRSRSTPWLFRWLDGGRAAFNTGRLLPPTWR
jgi:hypothetical protein